MNFFIHKVRQKYALYPPHKIVRIESTLLEELLSKNGIKKGKTNSSKLVRKDRK
jgi:hypothetical protein